MDAQELMTILESLTPGGSEFHNSPKNCAEWVRDRLATSGKIAAERNDLRRQLEIERQLVDEFATKAAVLDHQLATISKAMRGMVGAPPAIVHQLQDVIDQVIAEYDAGLILSVTELAAELEGAHGVDRAGVGS